MWQKLGNAVEFHNTMRFSKIIKPQIRLFGYLADLDADTCKTRVPLRVKQRYERATRIGTHWGLKKWLPLCRRHFQMDLLDKSLYFEWNFTDFFPCGSINNRSALTQQNLYICPSSSRTLVPYICDRNTTIKKSKDRVYVKWKCKEYFSQLKSNSKCENKHKTN